MHVLNKDMNKVKTFLLKNRGIVVPFSTRGVHAKLELDIYMLHKALKTLCSTGYCEKVGAWQHAWYFVTNEGMDKLMNELGKEDLYTAENTEVAAKI